MMILCLDIGNSHIFGGVYDKDTLKLQFRYSSTASATSDQLGIFFKAVLRENNIEFHAIQKVAICSVVPSLNYSVRSAFLKYFTHDPFFLDGDKVTQLTIGYHRPQEVGADRISNAIAAIDHYPNQDLIVIDLGTATTFDVISRDKVYLGGIIIPGMSISMKALYENTAKLSPVDIIKPKKIIGQSTTENIQSGLYYSHVGAMREMIKRIKQTAFHDTEPVIIGTGGFAHLFEDEKLFAKIIPELVLQGLYRWCHEGVFRCLY